MIGFQVCSSVHRNARVLVALASLTSCGGAAPSNGEGVPPPTMGISFEHRCYRVWIGAESPEKKEAPPKCEEPGDEPLPPVDARFRIDDVRTPRATDGTLEVVVQSASFSAIRVPPLNLRLDDKPRPVEFVAKIPAEKAECSVFTLYLSAKAGPDVFEGEIESPCGG